jgi:RNA-binding protein PNO1
VILPKATPSQHNGDDAMDSGDILAPVTDISASTKPDAKKTAANDDELMIDVDPSAPALGAAPAFAPMPASAQRALLKSEIRRVPVPPHRMSPLQKDWINIFGPLTELLGLQVRMNTQRKCVEIRVSAANYKLVASF